MSFGSSLKPILERCSLSREVKQNPFTRVKISCFTLHRVFVATSKLKMTAGMAFQTTKYSGLNFRKFPAWKRTTFSEIFRFFENMHSTFPFSPNFHSMVRISEIQQFSEFPEIFPGNFKIYSHWKFRKFCSFGKRPALIKLPCTWNKVNFEIK